MEPLALKPIVFLSPSFLVCLFPLSRSLCSLSSTHVVFSFPSHLSKWVSIKTIFLHPPPKKDYFQKKAKGTLNLWVVFWFSLYWAHMENNLKEPKTFRNGVVVVEIRHLPCIWLPQLWPWFKSPMSYMVPEQHQCGVSSEPRGRKNFLIL